MSKIFAIASPMALFSASIALISGGWRHATISCGPVYSNEDILAGIILCFASVYTLIFIEKAK